MFRHDRVSPLISKETSKMGRRNGAISVSTLITITCPNYDHNYNVLLRKTSGSFVYLVIVYFTANKYF